MKKIVLLIMAGLILMPAVVFADLVNPGFEDGSLGWKVKGNIDFAFESDIGGIKFMPVEGIVMAKISDPSMGGFVMENILQQTFTLGSDKKYLNLQYRFWTFDEGDYDKFVVLLDGESIFSISASAAVLNDTINAIDYTEWTGISIILPEFDNRGEDIKISIAFSAGNTGDSLYNSGVFLDDMSLTNADDRPDYEIINGASVPIPSGILLLASGLSVLVLNKRRRSNS